MSSLHLSKSVLRGSSLPTRQVASRILSRSSYRRCLDSAVRLGSYRQCQRRGLHDTTIQRQEPATAIPEPEPYAAPHHRSSASKNKRPVELFMHNENFKPSPKRIKVKVDDNVYTFDNLFLRDACRCHKCVDPSTTQKNFQTTDIPVDIQPKRLFIGNEALHIVWNKPITNEPESRDSTGKLKDHESVYPVEFLRKYANPRTIVRGNNNDRMQTLWYGNMMKDDVLWMEYDEYMSSDEKLWEFVSHLGNYGLAFLRNVPEGQQQDGSLVAAQRIGNLKNTFYGQTWDVRFDNNTLKNVAYTNVELGLHMDLLYYESPPGVQILHCLRNSVSGGSSYFADAFYAANIIRQSSESAFQSLCEFPVTFHYNNGGHHWHYTRPTIVLEPASDTYRERRRIAEMNWGPPFQAPFEMDQNGVRVTDSSLWRQWVNAAKELDKLIQDPRNQYEMTLKEGDCAVFMNRRVLHARRAFDTSVGQRWLKGSYIDTDTFRSTYRTLMERFKYKSDGQSTPLRAATDDGAGRDTPKTYTRTIA